MATIIKFKGADRPFAHMFFFQLTDTAPDLVDHFMHLCVKYLSGHPGQQHFSVGVRALEINRDVSGTNFEVSVHMIFDNIAAFNDYSQAPTHEKFITESAGMSPERIVYDSYLRVSVLRKAQAPGKKKAAPKKRAKA
jgi:Stress responsive A/B Barrel Domain